MPGPERISLNTATTSKQWSLPEALDGCLRHGLGGICPWRSDIAAAGLAESARLIRESGLGVSGLCRGGMFTVDGALTQRVIDDNRSAVDEAAEIGAACLVMVVGGLPPGSRDLDAARATVTEGLARTLEHARGVGVPVAIEPLHPVYTADRSVVSTTAQALDICEALGAGIGVALDVYHIWWDPAIRAQIARAGDRLFAFHICDWLAETRDPLLDRGMMGDGVADVPELRAAAEAAGYTGLLEVEIFSVRDWWTRDPDEVLATIVARSATQA